MKRGQMFTMDLILGLLIMIGALLALLVYTPSERAPFRDDLERMSVLMSEGVPANWTTASVSVPGFLSDGAFNETKITAFSNLTLAEQRSLLGVVTHMQIRFIVNSTSHSLCASCGESVPVSYEDLLVIRRYAVLNGTGATMEITLWR